MIIQDKTSQTLQSRMLHLGFGEAGHVLVKAAELHFRVSSLAAKWNFSLLLAILMQVARPDSRKCISVRAV